MVCYADDTLVLTAGDNWATAADAAERAVSLVVKAIGVLGLRVSPHKTEAIYFWGPTSGKPPRMTVQVAGVSIETGSEMRYLGLTLDGR